MTSEPKRAIIIGCGGIGSWLAEGLARALNFQAPKSLLVLVDGDIFEQKNAERQNFAMIGPKAHILRSELNPKVIDVFIQSKFAWVVSDEAASEYKALSDEEKLAAEDGNSISKIAPSDLVKEGDHVFCVVDNFAARKLVIDYAKTLNNVDVYLGGNGSVETGDPLFGTVYHYQRRDGEDVTSPPEVYHEEFLNPPDRNTGELSCQERAELEGGTQVMAINLAVAATILAKFSQVAFADEEEQEYSLQSSEIYIDLREGGAAPYNRSVKQEAATTVSVS